MTFPHERFERYFASGSNHAGEIKGLALSGMHIGVSVNALDSKGEALAELKLLRCTGTMVFVDSGAFGEVRFDPKAGGFVTVEEITDAEWDRRLKVYEELAPVLVDSLYVVAPDKVGDQEETLARLARYASRIKKLATEHHGNVIVPIQNGKMTAIEFDRKVREIFGDLPFVRGIPSKKGATTTSQLRRYCKDLLWEPGLEVTGLRFHLLGLGPYSKRYEEVRSAVPGWAADVTCDSVRITALVGRTNGKGGGPRELTARRDRFLVEHPDKAGDVVEVKFRTVQRHFLDEDFEQMEASMRAGWYDEELYDSAKEALAAFLERKAERLASRKW